MTTDELAHLRRLHARLAEVHEQQHAQLVELRAERDAAELGRAAADEARRRAERELAEVRRRLDHVEGSTTWRVGRAVMAVPTRAKDAWRSRRR